MQMRKRHAYREGIYANKEKVFFYMNTVGKYEKEGSYIDAYKYINKG